jgi:aspartate racemase
MKKKFKTIGIVGGAGPVASACLYESILRVCQTKYLANDYGDFPEIVLISYPFTRGDGGKIRKEIELCLEKLANAGASLFCIASHSFHGFLPNLPNSGFIHLVEEGLKEIQKRSIIKSLILAAPKTIELKLYETSELECVYPNKSNQESLNALIRDVASGKEKKGLAQKLEKIIESCQKEQSIDGVVLACSELSALPISLPVVDPIAILAERLVDAAAM